MNTQTRTIQLTFPIREFSTVKKISKGMGWTISVPPATDEDKFLANFRDAVKSAKDFKEGRTDYMSMEELMNEL